jgi:hypothetical protein
LKSKSCGSAVVGCAFPIELAEPGASQPQFPPHFDDIPLFQPPSDASSREIGRTVDAAQRKYKLARTVGDNLTSIDFEKPHDEYTTFDLGSDTLPRHLVFLWPSDIAI